MKQRTEDKFKSGIYVIQNKKKQKKYVGKALDIYKRIKSHVTALNTQSKDENRHLINSWHKYGREAFSYYVIEYIYEFNVQRPFFIRKSFLLNSDLFYVHIDPYLCANARL